MMVSTDPRKPITPEGNLPSAEVFLDDEPLLIINDRKVCPQCGGFGCDECE